MNIFYKVLLLAATLLLNLLVQAQDLRHSPELQERLTQAKLVEIQRALKLSDAQVQALSPIYKRYEKDLMALHAARQNSRPGHMMHMNPDSLSAEEADRIISAQLESAVKMSTIRKNYYPEFKTVLTPQQVMRLYQSEARLRQKVMQEFRRRFDNRRKRE